jgi:hypothetical protein
MRDWGESLISMSRQLRLAGHAFVGKDLDRGEHVLEDPRMRAVMPDSEEELAQKSEELETGFAGMIFGEEDLQESCETFCCHLKKMVNWKEIDLTEVST